MDDAGAGRHDAQPIEGGLCPAQQLVALAVAFVFAVDVEGEGVRRAEAVDLHRVVDDEIGWHERVDHLGVTAERGYGVAHCGKIDHGRYAGEVLHQHAGGQEWCLQFRRAAWLPMGEGAHLFLADHAAAGVANDVLEQHLDRHRHAREVTSAGKPVEPVIRDADVACLEPGTG